MSAAGARPSLILALLALSLPVLAAGQERPDEGELFGEPGLPPTAAQPAPAGAPPAAEAAAGGALEPEPGAERRLLADLARSDDPLQLGGLLYLRTSASAREGAPPAEWTLSAPSLLDLYLDARPSDRVRGFALGRMLFDPLQGLATSLVPGVELPVTAAAPSNPRVVLDQLWLGFDAGRRAFFTVGRQHVKWGVGRFWNPTDYLHAVRRDPLALLDQRTGTFLARVQVPWERLGWSFQGVAILEPLLGRASDPFGSSAGGGTGGTGDEGESAAGNQVGNVGAGARAEILVGDFELGLDAVVQRGIRPRFGADLSGPLGELDVHAELALRTSCRRPPLPRLARPARLRPVRAGGGAAHGGGGGRVVPPVLGQRRLHPGCRVLLQLQRLRGRLALPAAARRRRLHPLLPGAPLRGGLRRPPQAGQLGPALVHALGHRQPLRPLGGGAPRLDGDRARPTCSSRPSCRLTSAAPGASFASLSTSRPTWVAPACRR